MKRQSSWLVMVITASLLQFGHVTAKPRAAEPVLKKAVITFIIPEGDDKDTDTAVSVSITTKFNNQFDLTLASRNGFANNDTWEDPGGKEYTYELSAATGTKLSQISGDVKTRITINPVGNDTVKFNYRLILIFDDDDPNTPASELKQERDGITLSQDNRTYTS
jgi:hypothetical protein